MWVRVGILVIQQPYPKNLSYRYTITSTLCDWNNVVGGALEESLRCKGAEGAIRRAGCATVAIPIGSGGGYSYGGPYHYLQKIAERLHEDGCLCPRCGSSFAPHHFLAGLLGLFHHLILRV